MKRTDTIDIDNLDQLKFTTINQTWFKFLAFVSFVCALLVNAALIWLIVCRPNRLPKTDEEIKKIAIMAENSKRKRKLCKKRKQMNFKTRLKYLLFGKLKVRSPSLISFSSGSNEKKVKNRKINKVLSSSN
jgi:hypothetical protein